MSLLGSADQGSEFLNEKVDTVRLKLLFRQRAIALERAPQVFDGFSHLRQRDAVLAANTSKHKCLGEIDERHLAVLLVGDFDHWAEKLVAVLDPVALAHKPCAQSRSGEAQVHRGLAYAVGGHFSQVTFS
jgi:hypothetical protein